MKKNETSLEKKGEKDEKNGVVVMSISNSRLAKTDPIEVLDELSLQARMQFPKLKFLGHFNVRGNGENTEYLFRYKE